jgi:hypothetical protein
VQQKVARRPIDRYPMRFMSSTANTFEAMPLDAHPPLSAAQVCRRRRVYGLLFAVGGFCLLALAAWMNPSADGHGTHTQLGLPPCNWVVALDMPCPTCGMTTAFSYAADGRILTAFHTQPLGGLLAVAVAMATLMGAYTALTASPLAGDILRRWTMKMTWILIAMIVLSWFWKIATFKGWI